MSAFFVASYFILMTEAKVFKTTTSGTQTIFTFHVFIV